MTKLELRVTAILASIFALRMLGLCLLLPVFAVEALKYSSATPQLIGLAIGIYGLAQALLQVPFGMLSDKFGRKPMIWLGLSLIVLGSVIGYYATSIYGLILGRILQGCGAIGSVVLALLADQIRPQVRTMAMAILGISIGGAFALGFVIGPWLNELLGMSGIFLAIGIMALLGSGLLLAIPNIAMYQAARSAASSYKQNLLNVWHNKRLRMLNFGVFALHASLAAVFLVLPGILQANGLDEQHWWQLYLGVFVLAGLIVWRMIKLNERNVSTTRVLQMLAIAAMFSAEALFHLSQQWWSIAATLVIFFTGFCWLEASLPALVSKHAAVESRGTALGAYACLQFLGMFIGGVAGGALQSVAGANLVLTACMLLALIWLGLNFKVHLREVKEWQGV